MKIYLLLENPQYSKHKCNSSPLHFTFAKFFLLNWHVVLTKQIKHKF